MYDIWEGLMLHRWGCGIALSDSLAKEHRRRHNCLNQEALHPLPLTQSVRDSTIGSESGPHLAHKS